MRVEVDPSRGGSILSLRTGSEQDEWIYYDPGRRLPSLGAGVAYDDVWAGGFEELFPNDAPGRWDGRVLADHGELWSASLEVLAADAQSVSLRHVCRTVPAQVEKTVVLDEAGTGLTIRYRILNTGGAALSYLFKLHAAMRVEAGDRILLPGGNVTAVDLDFSRILSSSQPCPWPCAGDARRPAADLSVVPSPDSGLQEFVYVSELPAGWCGLERAASGERVRFEYSSEVFPYCWLFLAYGGWRGHYTVVLEPCTNMPKDLAAARARGRCAELATGASRAFDVRVTIES